jgi:hypothetical protein
MAGTFSLLKLRGALVVAPSGGDIAKKDFFVKIRSLRRRYVSDWHRLCRSG